MARSRSRSRERSSRKRSSSDESDHERRKRDRKKKKRRSRSRSRSTDSERRKYKSSSSSSSRCRQLGHSSGHSRSNSRSERRGERYGRRDRSTSRSPIERKRKDRSKSRSPYERRRKEKDERRRDTQDKRDSGLDEKRDVRSIRGKDEGFSLKERVAKLTVSSKSNPEQESSLSSTNFEMDSEKIAEIEAQGFHQQVFVSNATKKSDSKSNGTESDIVLPGNASSHESAIFGSSSQSFSTAVTSNSLPTNGLLNHDYEDDLFGPSLLVDQDLRTERWLQKLSFIRQKILKNSS